ncbi:MAG: flavodoxin family protein [Desulfovibrio sp.]|jgi:multimeric flavodoxin WrbA|nr:flavodoxin family protein [Desulfovibrio sp.]
MHASSTAPRVCILAGSPRKNGNTASLLRPFSETLERRGAAVELIRLHERTIKPCIACRTCQNVRDAFGCPFDDDMQSVFLSVLAADCLVLATPVYSWYCTAPMKAALDRLVYGMNKYYGAIQGLSLWEGKTAALFLTCGYRIENAAGPFRTGMINYCRHSKLHYAGTFAARDRGYAVPFMTEEKTAGAADFAARLHNRLITRDTDAEPISVAVE